MTAKSYLDGFAFERLQRIGGEKLVARLIDLFLETVPQRLDVAESGERVGDLETVARTVHSLRSSFEILGAGALATLAGRIEESACEGNASPVGALLNELSAGVQNALQELREERKKFE